jgi:hypothetical protein
VIEVHVNGDIPQIVKLFEEPVLYRWVIDHSILDIEPWKLFLNAEILAVSDGLSKRYPSRSLIPFARRIDNDDIACWDLAEEGHPVQIIHDYASSGWENRRKFSDFEEWLREAFSDFIEWSTL